VIGHLATRISEQSNKTEILISEKEESQMSETLDGKILSQEQMEKLPADVRIGMRERMNTEAREKARQILSEEPAPIEPTISAEKDNDAAMEVNPVQPQKKRKLPPKKKSEEAPEKRLPKRPRGFQKTSATQFGFTTTKKKFTVQITERLMREFKIEALRRGLNYSELAEKAFTDIFIRAGDSQPSSED